MSTRDDVRPLMLENLLGTSQHEAQAIISALAEVRDLPGAVCEFGVAQGRTSALIANEIRDETTVLHLFDSFQGLPAPGEKDELKDDIFKLGSMAAYAGAMSIPQEHVEEQLRSIGFPRGRVEIHAGFLETTLRRWEELPARVKFAYLDVDLYEGTKAALAFLDSACRPGSIVIVDDYGYFSSGVKTAVDDFIARTAGMWTMEAGEFFATLRRV
jgi:O-methyltransferase